KPKVRDKGNLASMGIYVFKARTLMHRMIAASEEHPDLDFGHHLIPGLIEETRVFAYPFEGYWVDVGTVAAYWQTSMDLLDPDSPLELYNSDWTIHTVSQERPPVKIGPQAKSDQSMISNGSIVRGQVERSVLSPGVYVSPGAIVRESVVMNDTWIGPGAVLDKVIIDKQVVIGAGAHVGYGDDYDTPNKEFPNKIDTGISVVGKSAHIPANVTIGRNVLINADVDEEAFEPYGDTVPSGEII
ncbi:MAG: sugar phosphate nucleotidyltransferase, partial [Chloroflexota bacterium]|nr:sugar phosphate nucleotidyltransferase [Chloroflexota bacterium]